MSQLFPLQFVVLYQDRLEDDRRRTEHRRFTTIRKQMTELDLKAVSYRELSVFREDK